MTVAEAKKPPHLIASVQVEVGWLHILVGHLVNEEELYGGHQLVWPDHAKQQQALEHVQLGCPGLRELLAGGVPAVVDGLGGGAGKGRGGAEWLHTQVVKEGVRGGQARAGIHMSTWLHLT